MFLTGRFNLWLVLKNLVSVYRGSLPLTNRSELDQLWLRETRLPLTAFLSFLDSVEVAVVNLAERKAAVVVLIDRFLQIHGVAPVDGQCSSTLLVSVFFDQGLYAPRAPIVLRL